MSGIHGYSDRTDPPRSLPCDIRYSNYRGDVECPNCGTESSIAQISVKKCSCCGRHEELYQCSGCHEWIETDIAELERNQRIAARLAERQKLNSPGTGSRDAGAGGTSLTVGPGTSSQRVAS